MAPPCVCVQDHGHRCKAGPRLAARILRAQLFGAGVFAIIRGWSIVAAGAIMLSRA